MARRPTAEYDIRANDASDAGWRSAINTAHRNGQKLKSTIGTSFAGLISVNLFTTQISKAIEFGDEIGKLKVKFGATAAATQELVAVARQFDVEIDSLATSFKKMQIAVSQAATGNKEMRETFAALGLDVEKLMRMKPDEQFVVIGDAISRLREEEERARAENNVFGRSGSNLRPMFENGAEGIRKARMEVHQFGHVLSDIDIKKLQEADDAIKKLSASWNAFWRNVAVGTVHVAQAFDVIDKDVIGELKDQLALANKELQDATMLPEGGAFDPERYKRAAEAVQVLQRQIANLEATYSRGGGSRRGRVTPAAPGFAAASIEDPAPTGEAWANLMRKARKDLANDTFDRDQMARGESARSLSDLVDRGTLDLLADQAKAAEDALSDLPEPILQLSDSLIQADELQDEFTRSMYGNFRDLFMHIGDGADDFEESMINAFKGILADRATLEFFNLMGSLGSSLTGSSGGKGFWGFIGAGLTSLFGGTKAEGGPLNPGKWYIAGERGPEAVWGGGAGAFAMGYGGGGGNVTIINNVDARNSTPDSMKLLPEILKRNNDALEARVVSRLKSGRYG